MNNSNTINESNTDYPAQTGIIGVGSAVFGFFISIFEYGILFIIHELSSILGIETQGKDLNYILEQFNKALEDPQTREQLRLILTSLGEIFIIFLDELKEPLKEVVYEFIDIGADASNKIIKRLVDNMLDAIGIIPGAGEVLEAIRAIDDVVIQIQALIGVAIKSSTLFINFFGTSLDSINNIKTRIKGVTDKINSQIGSINSFVDIPSVDELRNKLASRIKTEIPNPQAYLDTKKNELSQKNWNPKSKRILRKKKNELSQKMKEKVKETQNAMIDKGISAITPTNSNYSPSTQTAGASKNAKRNIKLTTQRIKRTIKKFCNRHNKTKKCRRKFNKK